MPELDYEHPTASATKVRRHLLARRGSVFFPRSRACADRANKVFSGRLAMDRAQGISEIRSGAPARFTPRRQACEPVGVGGVIVRTFKTPPPPCTRGLHQGHRRRRQINARRGRDIRDREQTV